MNSEYTADLFTTTTPKSSSTSMKWDELNIIFNKVKNEIISNPELLKLNKDISSWKLSWNRRKGALGLCKYSSKLIEISIYMLWGNASNEVLENTIRHEFAHALTPGHHHDETWKAVAKKIGCDGKRCSSDTTLSVSAPKTYTIKCIDGGDGHFSMKRHNRPGIQKMNKWCCPKCRGKLQIFKNVYSGSKY